MVKVSRASKPVSALTIGQLSKETGCEVPTIRYYEQVGILEKPTRTEGGHRSYTNTQLQRLRFIRRCRDLGFPLEDVKDLLRLADNLEANCSAADVIATQRLADVRKKIAHLTVLETELKRMVRGCRKDKIADCRIIQALSK